jgi:sporulation protein YlmC with PRC-barrel domain
MLENAESMGANAVEEVLIDYVSMGGLQGSITIVTATGTAIILGEKGSGESNMDRIIEKIKLSDHQDKDEIIPVEDVKTSEIIVKDVYTDLDQLQDETNSAILDLDFAPSEDYKELEKRYLAVSRDLENLGNTFEEDTISKSEMGDKLRLFNTSDYRGMDIMRTKEEIIGKEVVDVNARVIGKVKDVDINLETRTVERLIVGQGGILQGIRSSEDIIIPLDMVMAVGDKILIKSG